MREGIFTKDVNGFFCNENNVRYIVTERKEVTTNKPKSFIVAVVEDKRKYVSSLFPTSKKNVFNADYQGYKYTVEFTPNQVIVKSRNNA